MEYKKITVKHIYGNGMHDFSIHSCETPFEFIALICEFHKSESWRIFDVKGAKQGTVKHPGYFNYIVEMIGWLWDGVFSENEVHIELREYDTESDAKADFANLYRKG